MMRWISVPLVVALTGCSVAQKEAPSPSETFSVDDLNITIREVETPKEVRDAIEKRNQVNESNPAFEAIGLVEIGAIINIGKDVWDIVAANKAVSNTATDWASATPKGIESVQDLAGFSDVVSKSYVMDAKNVLNVKIFSLTYTVVHQYGGNYEGKGKYLANVSIVPSKVDVAWSYKLDLKTTKVQTTNVGTAENPVASLVMSMHAKVDGATKSREFNRVFQFRGDSANVKQIQ